MLPVWFPQPGTMVLLLDLLHRLHSLYCLTSLLGATSDLEISHRGICVHRPCGRRWRTEVEDRGGGERLPVGFQ